MRFFLFHCISICAKNSLLIYKWELCNYNCQRHLYLYLSVSNMPYNPRKIMVELSLLADLLLTM